MPKLPDATAFGDSPKPQVQTGIVSYKPTSGFEDAQGRALVNLGGTLQGVYQELEREQKRVDTVVAEDAFNQLQSKRLDLTHGDDGFTKVVGRDAATKPVMQDYNKRFDDSTEEIIKGLGNDQQKALFRQRSNITRLQYQHDLVNHLTREKDRYADSVTKDGIALETQTALDNYGDPVKVKTSLTRIDGLLAAQAERKKWSPETEGLARNEVYSNVHSSIIKRMLANDNDILATEYYNANKDNIHGNDKISVEHALDVGSTRGASQRAADAAIAKSKGDLGLALDKVKAIKNPKVREAATSLVKQQISDQETAEKLRGDNSFSHAMQVVESTGDFNRIPPDVIVQLSKQKGAFAALQQRADEIKNGKIPETDPAVWAEFNIISQDFNRLANMSDSEYFSKYYPRLGPTERERSNAIREAARKRTPESNQKLEDHVSYEQRLFDTAERMNIIKPQKGKTSEKDLSDDEKKMFGDFRMEADRRVREYQRANNLKHVDGDTKQKIIEQVATERYLKVKVPGIIWDKTMAIGDLTPEQRREAYVPVDSIHPESLRKMYRFAQSEGIVPRDVKYDDFVSRYKDRIQRARFADIQGASPSIISDILKGK